MQKKATSSHKNRLNHAHTYAGAVLGDFNNGKPDAETQYVLLFLIGKLAVWQYGIFRCCYKLQVFFMLNLPYPKIEIQTHSVSPLHMLIIDTNISHTSQSTLLALQFEWHQQRVRCRCGTWTLLGSVREKGEFTCHLFWQKSLGKRNDSLKSITDVYLRSIDLLLPDGNLISEVLNFESMMSLHGDTSGSGFSEQEEN